MIELEINKEKRLSYTVWTEKYRPSKISDVILPIGLKRFFNKLVSEKEIPNLLFYSSSPGVGKTTVAKALVKEIGADYLYINTSKENGIDTLRSKIDKFATSMSLTGNKKIVILDEFDGASRNLQDALRASIEEFHNICRFIFLCNSITKIIEPIQSRCQSGLIDFNFTDVKSKEQMMPQVVKRLIGILKTEKIEHSVEIIEKLANTFYPDIRKMIGVLQHYTKQNGIINNDIFNSQFISDELIDLIIAKKFRQAREFVIASNYNFAELYRFLYDKYLPKIEKTKYAQSLTIISEFMWRQSQGVLDPEINFAHCMIELMGV